MRRCTVHKYTYILLFFSFTFFRSLCLSRIFFSSSSSSSSSLLAFVSRFSSPTEVGLGLVVHVSSSFGIPTRETPPLLQLNRRHHTPLRAPRRHDGPRIAGSAPPRSAPSSGSSPSLASPCTSPSP
jgi:hypothetical protein